MNVQTLLLAVVLARGASKRIPRKNLALIGEHPLVVHIIQAARNSGLDLDVVLSTDDTEIAHIGKTAGAEVPFMRPANLSGDDVESLPVVQHAVLEMEALKAVTYEVIIYLQPTCPLCSPDDVRACVEKLHRSPDANSVVSITPVSTHPFKMKRLVDNERVINYIDQGFEDMRPRQKLPKVYRRAGSVYASRRHVIFEQNTLVGDPCLGVIVPEERAIDIDSPLDLELARVVYQQSLRKGKQTA